MSLQKMSTFAFAPNASITVIAIEYGSSPVDAALHQMRSARPLRWASSAASTGK